MLLFSFFAGCDETGEEVAPPFDLKFTVDIALSRQVTVSASAKNAKYYNVYFGISQNEVPLKTTDGKATYTYPADGTYTIRVQAHSTDKTYTTESKEITIPDSPEGIAIPTEGYATPLSYAGMTLVWQDEFNGPALNPAYWTHEIGTGTNGWGNNELQYYRPENTSFQDGHLIITAKKESFQGREYTSSRIITKDKKVFQYGRVDIRAALPKGQGIWPALWMLGSNISTVGWPKCGEIDIMEMIGGSGRENTILGTVHWDNNGHASYGNATTLSSGTYADKFHVFSIVWTANSITWFMDDIQYNTIDITPSALSEFKNPFFFIFNVAVGGNWPGSPDASSVYPQYMIVDYIRVFQ